MIISRLLTFSLLPSLTLALTLVTASYAAAQVETLDKVVAVVDDDIILASELRERLEGVKSGIQRRGIELPEEELLIRQTLDRLILESIQLQLAERYGIRIADAQLDAAMQRLASQNGLTLEQFRGALEAQGESYAMIRENMRQELSIQRVQQGNVMRNINVSDQEIDNFMETEEGQQMVQPEYRVYQALLEVRSSDSSSEIAAKEAFVDGVLAAILAGKPFSDAVAVLEPYAFSGGDLGWRKLGEIPSMFAEIVPTLKPGETGKVRSGSGFHLVYVENARGREQLIEQTEVRHILIKPSEVMTPEEAKALAGQLRQRVIEGGEDFALLAKEYSDDIGSAAEGGELGWVNPGVMVPAFESQMANAELNEVTEPFESEFGWHILEVTDRREKDFSNEMRRNQIANYLREQKYQEELDAWLRKIREEAFVDIK